MDSADAHQFHAGRPPQLQSSQVALECGTRHFLSHAWACGVVSWVGAGKAYLVSWVGAGAVAKLKPEASTKCEHRSASSGMRACMMVSMR